MLIADRFLSTASGAIDLATGARIDLRRLPPAARAQEAAWDESCATRSQATRLTTVRLVDYGLLADGTRFEAYRACARGEGGPSAETVSALGKQVSDLLATAALGEPRVLRLAVPALAIVVEALARLARLNGFVPLLFDLALSLDERPGCRLLGGGSTRGLRGSAAHLARREGRAAPPLSVEQRREVCEAMRARHLMLIAGHGVECRSALARLVVRIGAENARPSLFLLGLRTPAGATCGHCRAAPRGDAAGPPLQLVGGKRDHARMRAAETHETYRVAGSDLARLRTRAADALEQVRGPRCQRAEYALRGFAGALARRGDATGAAWVTISLGCLLLERGRALDAARAFESARQQFDCAHSARGAVRAAIYLGLAWTDDRRLAEASAALRCAAVAAGEIGARDLDVDARVALARCLYWQGRFDEAATIAAAAADAVDDLRGAPGASADRFDHEAVTRAAVARDGRVLDGWSTAAPRPSLEARAVIAADPDRRVRISALAARVALAGGDVRTAMGHATTALDAAKATAEPLDLLVAHGACASVHGALRDVESMRAHLCQGIAQARKAHATLRALRLRLLAADAFRHAGREAEARGFLRRLATLHGDRFPGLLRARLALVAGPPSDGVERRAVARGDEATQFAIAACPWRCEPAAGSLADDLVNVLETCHDSQDEEAALARSCAVLRDRVRALSVAIVGRGEAAAATFAHAGCLPGQAPLVDRVLDTGVAVAPLEAPRGREAASPVRYAGAVIGVVFARWAVDSLVDARRVGALLSAAAAAVAPQLRSLLDLAQAPTGQRPGEVVELVGDSDRIGALRKTLRRAAGAPFPVLIEGESGSGKELVARAIHRESARRARRFCAINCAALADDLLEAELFGHARGAFTGAVMERPGLFEEADGGTLFLDEVADLSLRAQAKLLRAVQEGEVRRIGENLARTVDARVVAATNRSLEAEVASGRFRRDLFYRLNVVHVVVPPLRDRPEDIPLLAAHFWRQATARTGSRATLAPATLAALARYQWPGNVRELQNVMAALAVASPHRGSVGPACLPAIIARREAEGPTLEAAREAFERGFVRAALARAGGHRARTATSLGMSRQGLAKVMARLGIEAGG